MSYNPILVPVLEIGTAVKASLDKETHFGDKDTVTIEQEDGQERVFDRDNIALIRLAFDF